MKAYKGFTKDMKCRGFQFEEGKTYEEKEAELCKSGFHACEKPLDVFGYYGPANSIYHEVELENVDPRREDDSKICAKRIKIGAKRSISDLVKADVAYTLSKIDKTKAQQRMTGNCSASTNTGNRSASNNTGNYSASTNTGDYSASTNTGNRSASTNTGNRSASNNTGNYSASTNTGNRSASTNTGNRSASTVTGKESVAASLGINGKAKGAIGCWIICAEWERRLDGWHRKDVQCVLVDGEAIKPDTFYMLKDGAFVEADIDE